MEDQNINEKSLNSSETNMNLKTQKEISKEESVVEYLTNLSSKLKKVKDREKKIQILVDFNEYLKLNGDIIEKKSPDKLVSILNSL